MKVYIYENKYLISNKKLEEGLPVKGNLAKNGNNMEFFAEKGHQPDYHYPVVTETEHFKMRKTKTGWRMTGTFADVAQVDANAIGREARIIVKNARIA